MFACEGDVITLQSVEEVKPGTPDNMTAHERYRWVLRRWDLSTGQRTNIPVTDPNGEPVEFTSKWFLSGYRGVQVGNEYRLVERYDRARAVDLTSGQLRRLFDTDPRMPVYDSYWMTYQVDKDGVYALGESHKDHVITLFFIPWDGKEWREIFTTDKLAGPGGGGGRGGAGGRAFRGGFGGGGNTTPRPHWRLSLAGLERSRAASTSTVRHPPGPARRRTPRSAPPTGPRARRGRRARRPSRCAG